MATKSKSKPAAKTESAAAGKKEAPASKAAGVFNMPNAADIAKYTKTLTPEQAFELYKTNAKIALDVIDAALESTGKIRKLQFASEEEARSMQKKAVRQAADADDVPTLMAASQNVTKEALEKSMAYWGQMFELVVEMQKRLFTLMEKQMSDVPGAKQAKAAMAMMPDLTQMQKVVSAMQGVMSSGGSAFESMQKVMQDFAKMSGGKR